MSSESKLTSHLIEGFVKGFLYTSFDNCKAIPDFHRSLWNLLCDPEKYVAISAPRGHAKSTAGTVVFTLASILFGFRHFVLLIGSSEDMIKQQFQSIVFYLTEDEHLSETFKISISRQTLTEIEGSCLGGRFKILCKGAGQKIRGTSWNLKRPDLVIVDDLEDDEQVENSDQRSKIRKWFQNAVLPCGSDTCLFRVFGTILHQDSLLEGLLNNSSWKSARFSAHKSFDDMSDILWPEKFSLSTLESIKERYINDANISGYGREYLSTALLQQDAYFRREMFLPMSFEDHQKKMTYYVGVDFAITKTERSDYTAMIVAGVDPWGSLNIVDVYRFRGDGTEIIDQIFTIEEKYHPDMWLMEKGQISHSLDSFLKSEMLKRRVFLKITPMATTGDKVKRARSIQKIMQIGGVKFNMLAPWYADLLSEFLAFDKGRHDDQVDALAHIGLFLDKVTTAQTPEEEELAEYARQERIGFHGQGRSRITGY